MSKIQPQKCEKTPIVMPLNDGKNQKPNPESLKITIVKLFKVKKSQL